MSYSGEFLALVFFLKFCEDVDECQLGKHDFLLSANVSIIWVHISAHIVDLDKLTMERQEQIDDGETRAIRVLVTPHVKRGLVVMAVFVLMDMKESFAK